MTSSRARILSHNPSYGIWWRHDAATYKRISNAVISEQHLYRTIAAPWRHLATHYTGLHKRKASRGVCIERAKEARLEVKRRFGINNRLKQFSGVIAQNRLCWAPSVHRLATRKHSISETTVVRGRPPIKYAYIHAPNWVSIMTFNVVHGIIVVLWGDGSQAILASRRIKLQTFSVLPGASVVTLRYRAIGSDDVIILNTYAVIV